jgi:hypothetical protein
MIDLDILKDGALILGGLDECVIGYSSDGVLIYDYEMMVDKFVEDDMDHEEAIEWIDYNILGLIHNGAGFIVKYDF